jgi:hypothetical protein
MLLELVAGFLLSAAPEGAAAQPATDKPQEKKICRKQIETGSLVKGKKICMTAKQWDKLASTARDEVERTAGMGSQSGQ